MGDVSIEDATNDLIAQIRKGDPYLRVVRGSAKSFEVATGRALAVAMRGVNPRTKLEERVTVVTRQLADDHLLYLLFATPERDTGKYSGTLNAMVRSLQVDEDRPH